MSAAAGPQGALFDTNILIGLMSTDERVADRAAEVLERFGRHFISYINWIEFMTGAHRHDPSPGQRNSREFLEDGFTLLWPDERIAEEAVQLRRDHRLKTPDALVWATARVHGLVFVTANTRDFRPGTEGVLVP